jgi:glycosyltransferase involved in cell wall biosynthesis
MAKKVRILQLIISDDPGILDLTREIAQTFKDEPYEITTAFLHATQHLADYSTAFSFHLKKSDLKGLRLKALWRLYRYCRQEKFNVVITHRFKPLHLMLTLNNFLNVPVCISVIHGFDEFKRRYRKRCVASGWSKHWHFVAVSEPVSAYLKRTLKLEANDISTIHNAVDVQRLTDSLKTKQHSRKLLGLENGTFVFGTIGRLVPLKGHLTLIKAFQITLEQYPQSQLLIIGGGREEAMLKQYINEQGLSQSVKLAGHIDDAASLLKALNVFVLPSLKEGFGLVLLEAMAAKLPIIASNTGGIPYVLKDLGQLIAPIDQPQAYAAAMLEQLSMNQAASLNGAKLLNKRLHDKFDISSFQQAWRKLLTERL